MASTGAAGTRSIVGEADLQTKGASDAMQPTWRGASLSDLAGPNRWPSAILGASIVFAGLMASGYAVFDELVVYLVLAYVVQQRLYSGRLSVIQEEPLVVRLHRYLFIAFAIYYAAQGIRGMFAVPDYRIIRFVAMFAALGLIAWCVQLPTKETALRARRVVAGSSAILCCAYILIGLIAENIFGVWRFDLQGHLWVGTSAAFVPVVVAMPALALTAASEEATDQKLFWWTVSTHALASFYYQSRTMWIALFIFLVVLLLLAQLRRVVAFLIMCGLLVVFFPWTSPNALTGAEFVRSFTVTMGGENPSETPGIKVLRFVDITFGSFLHTRFEEKAESAPKPQAPSAIQGPGSTAGAGSVAAGAGAASGTATGGAGPEPETATPERITSATDVDRKIALLATKRAVQSEGLFQVLFGTGYYTHRFVLLPYFHALEREYGYEFPETYRSIVRTATFNGMLVDGGVIGAALFLSLFGMTWLSALASARYARRPLALAVAVTGTLLVLGLSVFAASNFDMLVLYLAIMPAGAILAVFPARPAPEHAIT